MQNPEFNTLCDAIADELRRLDWVYCKETDKGLRVSTEDCLNNHVALVAEDGREWSGPADLILSRLRATSSGTTINNSALDLLLGSPVKLAKSISQQQDELTKLEASARLLLDDLGYVPAMLEDSIAKRIARLARAKKEVRDDFVWTLMGNNPRYLVEREASQVLDYLRETHEQQIRLCLTLKDILEFFQASDNCCSAELNSLLKKANAVLAEAKENVL